MTSPNPEIPLVTPLQFSFLTVLTEGPFCGNRMRAELARCGVFKSKDAFFRIMQRLKEANLVTASRVPRPEGEYRGAQAVYELTQDGRDATALMRGLYGKAGRRLRLRRWRRVRTPKLSHRFNRTAKRAAFAKRRDVSNGKSITYSAGASPGSTATCQNGIDSKLQTIDLKLQVCVRKNRSVELMLSPAPFEGLVTDLSLVKQHLGVVGSSFCGSNGRLDVSNRLREVRKGSFLISRSPSDLHQVENLAGRTARRSFKCPKRSFKSIGRRDRWLVPSSVACRWLVPRNARPREPPRLRLVQHSGDKKR